MSSKSIEARLSRAEGKLQGRGLCLPPGCICFPKKEQPFFYHLLQRDIAFAKKCPLHGQRFHQLPQIYVSKWLRDKEERPAPHTPQYWKAWHATFPPDLWPGKEVVIGDRVCLRLKDGTVLDAFPDSKIETGN